MVKPIRGEKGKFAGSIGDGKTVIPTASSLPEVATQNASRNESVSMEVLHAQHLRQLAVNTDTEIARLSDDIFSYDSKMHSGMERIHYLMGHRQERERIDGRWVWRYSSSDSETLAQAREFVTNEDEEEWKRGPIRQALLDYDSVRSARLAALARMQELEATYRRHLWTRAFLVQGGHVHSSMDCSTCNRQGSETRFAWLPQYSGSDETLIVEDAGERACTVCYPTAPVDVLQRPTRIFSEDERRQLEAAEERRVQRAASRAARAAKAPTASGEPLICDAGETTFQGRTRMRQVELKTERTALSYAADIVAAQQSGNNWMAPYEIQPTHYDSVLQTITASIAEKRGCSADEVLEEVTRKADIKVRKANR